MFEFVRFVFRNPAYVTKHARRASATRRAMIDYKEEHPACEWCGRDKHVEVHHNEPVSVAPEKAADPDNFTSLCRKPPCHQIIGHNGDFGRRYVANLSELLKYNKQEIVKVESDG